MKSEYRIAKLDCSKFDPEREDEHPPAEFLVRWKKDPFKNYPWTFCSECTDIVVEKSGAEVITELPR